VSLTNLLLSFSPIHAHSFSIFARSLFSHLRAARFGPAARSASAHSAQQSRCTLAEAQSALYFHPPFTLSSRSLLRPFFTSSLSLLARASRCSPPWFEQNYLLLYLFGPKAHVRSAVADSVSVPLAASVSLATASRSWFNLRSGRSTFLHDFVAVNQRVRSQLDHLGSVPKYSSKLKYRWLHTFIELSRTCVSEQKPQGLFTNRCRRQGAQPPVAPLLRIKTCCIALRQSVCDWLAAVALVALPDPAALPGPAATPSGCRRRLRPQQTKRRPRSPTSPPRPRERLLLPHQRSPGKATAAASTWR
jgi:hypothetical protein